MFMATHITNLQGTHPASCLPSSPTERPWVSSCLWPVPLLCFGSHFSPCPSNSTLDLVASICSFQFNHWHNPFYRGSQTTLESFLAPSSSSTPFPLHLKVLSQGSKFQSKTQQSVKHLLPHLSSRYSAFLPSSKHYYYFLWYLPRDPAQMYATSSYKQYHPVYIILQEECQLINIEGIMEIQQSPFYNQQSKD